MFGSRAFGDLEISRAGLGRSRGLSPARDIAVLETSHSDLYADALRKRRRVAVAERPWRAFAAWNPRKTCIKHLALVYLNHSASEPRWACPGESLLRQDLFEDFCDEFTRGQTGFGWSAFAGLSAAERATVPAVLCATDDSR